MADPSASSKVAVIHTDQAFREKLRFGLEHEGYQVVEAADGETGVGLIEKERPNLVLLDLVLPRLSGVKMMEQLTERLPAVKTLPTLVVIDSRTREDDIDGIVATCPDCQFIKNDWALGHIVAKSREMLSHAVPTSQIA